MSIPKKQPATSALENIPDFPEIPEALRNTQIFDKWNRELTEWWDVVRERIYEIEKTVSE